MKDKSSILKELPRNFQTNLIQWPEKILIRYSIDCNYKYQPFVDDSALNVESISPYFDSLNSKQIGEISKGFRRNFKEVSVAKQHFPLRGVLNYEFCLNSPFPFIMRVEEGVGVYLEDEGFGETSESIYLWLFFKWVRVKRIGTGIS